MTIHDQRINEKITITTSEEYSAPSFLPGPSPMLAKEDELKRQEAEDREREKNTPEVSRPLVVQSIIPKRLILNSKNPSVEELKQGANDIVSQTSIQFCSNNSGPLLLPGQNITQT